MRLLHTQTLSFTEFFDTKIPKYAILSHRWSDRETSFQDFIEQKDPNSEGYTKVTACCAFALERRIEWVWIDTCCIDKRSSAELSEAINSMFSWYARSAECYAYLCDVDSEIDGQETRSREACMESFSNSVWFARGWTLQELLAPAKVIFFDCRWKRVGTKVELKEAISSVTGIEASYLVSSKTIFEASVAMRMSWASNRSTSRTEDLAYCLLGLFDVNMPLLYGEGQKSFLRLQLEIIKVSDDESIFAWTSAEHRTGMLANSLAAFADSGDIVTRPMRPEDRLPYSMTNKGLEIRVKGTTKSPMGDDYEKLILGCGRWVQKPGKDPEFLLLAVGLRRYGETWRRVDGRKLEFSKRLKTPGSWLGADPVQTQKLVYVSQGDLPSRLLRNW